MTIRKFRPAEAQAIIDLTIQTFHDVSIARQLDILMGGKCGSTTWKERKAEEVRSDIMANPDGVLVAEEDGVIIGFITCLVDAQSKIGWIHHIAVAKERQGQGIGKQLMKAGLEYLRQQGMECCRIETTENNEVGKRFYPSVGFQEIARQIYYAMKL